MALPDMSTVVRELPLPMRAALAPLRKFSFALAFGVAGGLALCLATLALVLQGGPNVGDAMGRLVHVFPGYQVSYAGSVVGLGYGLLSGFVVGWLMAYFRDFLVAIHVFLLVIRERARASRNVLDDLM